MTNAIRAGETSCEYLFSQMGGKGKVLLVDGTPIQTIIDRIKGCKTSRKISGYQNRRAAGIPQRPRFQPDGHHRYAHRQSGCLRHFRYERSFRRSAQCWPLSRPGKAGAIKVTGVDGSPEAVEELKRSGSPFIGTATQNLGEMVRQPSSLAPGYG